MERVLMHVMAQHGKLNTMIQTVKYGVAVEASGIYTGKRLLKK